MNMLLKFEVLVDVVFDRTTFGSPPVYAKLSEVRRRLKENSDSEHC